ncbi:hypothetical protein THAOC_24262 [Thalassiosira oceanica]|uniref:Uncharacterized protein n=1 Tax=Thalassiosira oceanica TaxID=159749 RepID=K0S4T5_THAOC|nr:hypothetical protein THAOC_24262 [Thalassiosira oceanica]|eukprot:EJK55941.1 hypothetical protein THAOC_24262 [Thalassiosira oceanica]
MAILSRQISALTSSSKLKKTSSLALLLIASSARAFGTGTNLGRGHSIRVDSAATAPRGPARCISPAFGSYGSPTRFRSCNLQSAIANIRGGSSARFSSTLEELDSLDVVKETASRMSAAEKLERIRSRMAEYGVDGTSSNYPVCRCDKSI